MFRLARKALGLSVWDESPRLVLDGSPRDVAAGGAGKTAWQEVEGLLSGVTDPLGAICIFRKALCEEPRDIGIYSCLIALFLRAGDPRKAEYFWGIAVKIDPRSSLVWLAGAKAVLGLIEQRLRREAAVYTEAGSSLASTGSACSSLRGAGTSVRRVTLQDAYTRQERASALGGEEGDLRRLSAEIAWMESEIAEAEGRRDQALFWLKRAQVSDGGWEKPKVAMQLGRERLRGEERGAGAESPCRGGTGGEKSPVSRG